MAVKGAVKGFEEFKASPEAPSEETSELDHTRLNDLENQDLVALITAARSQLGMDQGHTDSTTICK